MDDISLYIDYIIMFGFYTPVSSFSLPLHRFLKTANFHRKTPFFKEVEILLCNQQEKVENLKKNLGERYRSTGEFENLVFVSSIELPSMRYNAEHTINKLIERVNFAECYKAKRKESLSLWNRLILIR